MMGVQLVSNKKSVNHYNSFVTAVHCGCNQPLFSIRCAILFYILSLFLTFWNEWKVKGEATHPESNMLLIGPNSFRSDIQHWPPLVQQACLTGCFDCEETHSCCSKNLFCGTCFYPHRPSPCHPERALGLNPCHANDLDSFVSGGSMKLKSSFPKCWMSFTWN